jgi:hypothetical protein
VAKILELIADYQPSDPLMAGLGERRLDDVAAHKLGRLPEPLRPPPQT